VPETGARTASATDRGCDVTIPIRRHSRVTACTGVAGRRGPSAMVSYRRHAMTGGYIPFYKCKDHSSLRSVAFGTLPPARGHAAALDVVGAGDVCQSGTACDGRDNIHCETDHRSTEVLRDLTLRSDARTAPTPRAGTHLREDLRVVVVRDGLHDSLCALGRVTRLQRVSDAALSVTGRREPTLKMPEPTKTPSQPSCIISAASAAKAISDGGTDIRQSRTGRRDPTGGEVDDREALQARHLLEEVERRLDVLRVRVQLLLVHAHHAAHGRGHVALVAHGLDDVARAGLALCADHRRALGDAAQRLPEVAAPAHERHLV
jgi:hypothetical protein